MFKIFISQRCYGLFNRASSFSYDPIQMQKLADELGRRQCRFLCINAGDEHGSFIYDEDQFHSDTSTGSFKDQDHSESHTHVYKNLSITKI